MRLVFAEAVNFGSYGAVTLDFKGTGLTLIHGKTGSGKSTLQDLVPWTLWGVTAKNGNADEVRSWTVAHEPTRGKVTVSLPTGFITVTRIRGPNGKNDLYWVEGPLEETLHRGKDLPDTQRLLETRLNVSADTYITAAYLHEFSETGQFFTAPAKARRSTLEKIADLDLATKLAAKASEQKREAKEKLDLIENHIARADTLVEQIKSYIADSETNIEVWDRTQATIAQQLQNKYDSFDRQKETDIDKLEQQIKVYVRQIQCPETLQADLDNQVRHLKTLTGRTCVKCGSPTDANERISAIDSISAIRAAIATNSSNIDKLNNIELALEARIAAKNYYGEQLETESGRVNPFLESIVKHREQLTVAEHRLAAIVAQHNTQGAMLSALERLYDLSGRLRGELLRRSVRELAQETNRYLETYFDSELRVNFEVEKGDSIEANIQKSGFDCTYRQLSKGQRQVLRLSFVCSVMKACANKAGTHFSHIMLDEALDGLDGELKVKAFRLLQELARDHEGVMVIDHSEDLKNLFDNKIHVIMKGDHSVIEKS